MLALLSLLSLSPAAYAAEPLDELQRLSDEGQYQEAYALASRYRQQLEGDVSFDFYYGVAAIESGEVHEGVFALERVVYRQPEHHRARLELARGYYLQGDDARARQAFERVLRSRPPAKVALNIERFLAAIRLRESRYQTTAKAYIELMTGSDSNINAGPADPLADSALPWTLDSSVLETDDTFTALLLGGRVNHPLTQHSSLFASVDGAWRRHANEGHYDNALATLQGGGRWQRENQRRQLALLLQQYSVDETVSRNLVGLTAENTWLQGAQQQFGVTLTALDLSYPEAPLKDSRQYTVGVQLLRAMDGMNWVASLSAGREIAESDSDAARAQADRTIYGVQLAGNWQLGDATGWGLKYGATHSHYSTHYLAGLLPRRKELLSSLDVSITHLLSKEWQLRGGVTYSRNDANIDMFNYTRTQASVGLRYEF
ncbi:MAG: hypothetical protein OQL08_12360 [Gammaproteobacteria bacterium]|nr:hypothetical protein [Gammaproteobacteria bacterium]